jgi:excinuclease ABC subunit C
MLAHKDSFSGKVVIDGGKGQLSSAIKGMAKAGVSPANSVAQLKGNIASETQNRATVAICALAKNAEELFIDGQSEPVNESPDSPALLLLRSIRDESHRFALSHHRQRRSIRKSSNQATYSGIRDE